MIYINVHLFVIIYLKDIFSNQFDPFIFTFSFEFAIYISNMYLPSTFLFSFKEMFRYGKKMNFLNCKYQFPFICFLTS